jgi:hypothetical protein
MIRRLFTLVAAVSLVLCLTTAVLWVRSYWRVEWYVWHWGDAPTVNEAGYSSGRLYFLSSEAEFSAMHTVSGSEAVDRSRWSLRDFSFGPHEYRALGFELWPGTYPMVYVPFWFVFLAVGLLVLSLRRCQSVCLAEPLCQKCSYDLTGNTGGVCPECGTDVELHAVPPGAPQHR